MNTNTPIYNNLVAEKAVREVTNNMFEDRELEIVDFEWFGDGWLPVYEMKKK